MNQLDEELRKLNINTLLPDEPSTVKDYKDVSKLPISIEDSNICADNSRGLKNYHIYGTDLTTKKVGPSVPPKPVKKSTNVPEIPQSSLVRQSCEPLYAQRLQRLEVYNYEDVISKQPLLLRKQSSYTSPDDGSVSNISTSAALKGHRKVTLDNPAILEQQLEVLEHHKKQLEKRGKLNQNSSSYCKSLAMHLSAPKLSTSSLLTDISLNTHNFLAKANVTYSNTTSISEASSILNPNICDNIISSATSPPNSIYANVCCDKNKQRQSRVEEQNISESQIPITKKKSVLFLNEDSGVYCTHNASMIAEDEIPAPPSPVSSSYSELRRATQVFKINNTPQNGSIITANDQINITKPTVSYEMPHDHKLTPGPNDMRQLHINKPPRVANDVFNNYNSGVQSNTDYYGYGDFSQTSCTYESIYEPINPRPSQLSARSQNNLHPTFTKNSNISSLPQSGDILAKSSSSNIITLCGISGGSNAYSNSAVHPISSRGSEGCGTLNKYTQNSKELEFESLKNFLEKSMHPQRNLENYGVCFKCNEIVVGENSGCTAMDQIYHIACFTCSQCQINLQGKPFYALDSKPYCEVDYLQTLEKCSVCMKPILERILRATGKPYHPQCFTCVACKESLDGIPFTVDATNQNYCIEDFHKKFAPRCCVCMEPIMPEPGEEETVRVVALDKSFHFECYKCEDCGLLLSSQSEGRGCYPLDDHVLCKSCNAKRVQVLTNRMTTTEL